MAIENSVSNDFGYTFAASINVFDCRLPGVLMTLHGVGVGRRQLDSDKTQENITFCVFLRRRNAQSYCTSVHVPGGGGGVL